MQSKFPAIALLAVLTSAPSVALAAPTLSVTKGGTRANNYLDDNGNWVWNIRISNSDPIPTGSSPLEAELGFTTSGSGGSFQRLIGASNLSTGANDDFYIDKPGTPIFGWEQLTDVGGGIMKALGLQTNCASGCTVTGSLNQVFSSLGSIDYNAIGPHDYIQIVTSGPWGGFGGGLVSTLTVSGAYGSKGRISEQDATDAMVNYDTFSNIFTRTALQGDANLDGSHDGGDLNLVLSNFGRGTDGPAGPLCVSPSVHACAWYHGDGNSDGRIDSGDLSLMLTGFGQKNTIGQGAGTSLVGANVPEPSSCLLLALSTVVSALGSRRRRSVTQNRT